MAVVERHEKVTNLVSSEDGESEFEFHRVLLSGRFPLLDYCRTQ